MVLYRCFSAHPLGRNKTCTRKLHHIYIYVFEKKNNQCGSVPGIQEKLGRNTSETITSKELSRVFTQTDRQPLYGQFGGFIIWCFTSLNPVPAHQSESAWLQTHTGK